jgi:hypothetical protein
VTATAQPTDPPVANATVTVEVRNAQAALVARLSGVTSAQGMFTSNWVAKLPNGTYTATVTSVTGASMTWNSSLGVRQRTHRIPH